MLTKAFIVEKPAIGDNIYKVRIPTLEGVGNNKEDNITVYDATLSYTPGNLDSYNVGEAVFVQFEDNDMSQVVITGKLYLGGETEASGYQNTQGLNVTDIANLSSNTYINGTKIGDMFVSQSTFNEFVNRDTIYYEVLDVD